MKKALLLATAALLCSCANPNRYTIDGTIDGYEGMVYLMDENENTVDSAQVADGKFRMQGETDAPRTFYLMVEDENDKPAYTNFVLEPGKLTVRGDVADLQALEVTGTPATDAGTAFARRMRKLLEEYRNPATALERREQIEAEFDRTIDSTLANNRDNYFGVMLLPQQAYRYSGRELLDEIARFSPAMQQTQALMELKSLAEQKIRTAVGQPYLDIVQNDPEGKPVSLASIVENPAAKYVLLDFWASWCGPCMGEVPYLVEAYKTYRQKGFEIYGVSFDQNRDNWLSAIERNGMNWTHVSDLNGFDNEAARTYAIQGIPSNFLIETATGKIVAANLRGEQLAEELAARLTAEKQ